MRIPLGVPRAVLGGLALLAASGTAAAFSGWQQQNREQTATEQVHHVLSRLTFGARPGDVQKVRAMGVDNWIAQQLNPQSIDDSRLEQFVRVSYPASGKSALEVVNEYQNPQRVVPANRRNEMTAADSLAQRQARQALQQLNGDLISSRVARALITERQLNEVMVDFWLNHFNVFIQKGQVRYFLTDYESRIRQSAMGNFRELLGSVAKSPAMLFYLDNFQSAADSARMTLTQLQLGAPRGSIIRPGNGRAGRGRVVVPPTGRGVLNPNMQQQQQRRRPGLNENYARELMELHTMGVDGGYTQQDVIEVARALTGWTIQNPQQVPVFTFRPETHDAEPKIVLGTRLPGGRGIEDGEQVLDIVASHPATARYISFKLARRFISDEPPESVVDRAAATFTRTGGDIREVVRTIVTSPEFFSTEAYRSKVKTPFELVVSSLRAINALPDATPRTAQTLNLLGQPIWGKETPNGYPDVAGEWMNTGAILNRINFGAAVAAGTFPGATLDRWDGWNRLQGGTREEQVDGVIAELLNGAASPDTRAILLSGENPLAGAADADSSDMGVMTPPGRGRGGRAGRAGRAGAAGQAVRPGQARGGRGAPLGRGPAPNLQGLAQVVGLALGSPEFQRR